MSMPTRLSRLLVAVIVMGATPLAAAWPPAGVGPYPPGNPGWYPGGGAGPVPGMRLVRTTVDDAYLLGIELTGIGPEEIQVRTRGHWILISRERTDQQMQQDSFDEGRAGMYSYSYSYSSGTTRRRLAVPADGDLDAMRREDREASILIRIPRRGR